MHSQSGGGGRQSSLLSDGEEVEKTRLGTSAMGGVSSDSSNVEVGRTVRGGAEAGRWGDLDALNVLLGGDKNAVSKWATSMGERGPSSSVSTFSSVTMTGRVTSV